MKSLKYSPACLSVLVSLRACLLVKETCWACSSSLVSGASSLIDPIRAVLWVRSPVMQRERERHYIFSSHLRADQMCRGSFLGTHQ